jgi:hypothetical protein
MAWFADSPRWISEKEKIEAKAAGRRFMDMWVLHGLRGLSGVRLA